jgi:hypothetical protein
MRLHWDLLGVLHLGPSTWKAASKLSLKGLGWRRGGGGTWLHTLLGLVETHWTLAFSSDTSRKQGEYDGMVLVYVIACLGYWYGPWTMALITWWTLNYRSVFLVFSLIHPRGEPIAKNHTRGKRQSTLCWVDARFRPTNVGHYQWATKSPRTTISAHLGNSEGSMLMNSPIACKLLAHFNILFLMNIYHLSMIYMLFTIMLQLKSRTSKPKIYDFLCHA